MIKEVTATGADVNAAIDSGALLLGTSREEVQFEIVSLPKKGFLGIKQYPAKVRVWIEVPEEKQQKPAAPKSAAPASAPAPQRTERPQHEQRENRENRAPKPQRENRAPKAEAPAPAVRPVATLPEEAMPAEVEPTAEVRAKVEKAAAYVKDILTQMGLTDVELTPRYYAENVRLQLTGTGIGSVIGRRGETLDSLQYLASLAANRGEGDYIRLNIDSGNYREKRARTLEALARKLANQAVRSGKSTTLEPMNPYERRIIHGAVSSVRGATSSSIGVEPNRRVVISAIDAPKREAGARPEGARPEGGNRGNRGGRPGGPRPARSGESRPQGGNRGGRPAPRPGAPRRMDDPPAIGGPVRREQTAPAAKAEKSDLEKEIVSTAKRYGKIDI